MKDFSKPDDQYQPSGKYRGKRAAVYKRLSDEKQEEGLSLEFQDEKTREASKLEGCTLDEKHVWSDIHTGIEVFERPALTALRAAAKRHEFDVLFVYKLDRFSRIAWHQEMVREELKRHGITIVSLKKEEHSDDDSMAGQIIRTIYAFIAEEERKNIIQRTRDGVRARVRKGRILPSHKPLYGYSWDDPSEGKKHSYVINPQEASIVYRMFEMAKSGTSLRGIAKQLNAENIPSPAGKTWCYQSIRARLSHPFYMGKAAAYRWHHEKLPGMRIRQHRRHEDEQIELPEGTVPPIIDRATFEAVQYQIALNKQKAARNNKNPQDALLRCGLIVCGYCGRNMSVARGGHSRKGRKAMYRCPSSADRSIECERPTITCEIIDNAVWARAVKIIHNPALVLEAVQKRRKEDPTKDNRKALKKRLSELPAEIENATKTVLESKNEKVRAIMAQQLEALANEQEQIQRALHAIDIQREEWKEGEKKLDEFVQECARMREELSAGNEPTYGWKRKACEYFGLKALVWRADHKPQYAIEADPPHIVSKEG